MQRIMVLGAGGGQLPLISFCKKCGYYVMAVGGKIATEVEAVADETEVCDVRDKEKVFKIARSFMPNGIVTDQLDIGVQSAAYAADCLGIPSVGYETAIKFTNKFEMRNCAREANIKQPEYRLVNTLKEAYNAVNEIGLPCMIKPVDSDGSRGISIVRQFTQINEAFGAALEFSKSKSLIIEQKLEGKLFEIEGFCQKGVYSPLCISSETCFGKQKNAITNKELFKSIQCELSALEKQIVITEKRLIQHMGLSFGPVQSEYLFDGKDIYLIETAARGGGVYISSDIIPFCCGVDIHGLLIKFATDSQAEIETIAPRSGAAGFVCFALPVGTISKIEGLDKLRCIQGVEKIFLQDIRLGEETKPLENKAGRYGPIILKGKDIPSLEHTIQTIRKTLVIKVGFAGTENDIIWD